MTDTNPSKNLTSRIKALIKVGRDNRYTLNFQNSYQYPLTVQAVYVIYDKNGKAIYMNTDSVSVPGKGKESQTFYCPAEKEAASAKIYVSAAGF